MTQQHQLDLASLVTADIRVRKPKRVLLVEPAYKVKYPPLGLMKISTYHKRRGDEVVFYKGTRAEVRDHNWDTIYIATMFTYQWKTTIHTIKFYQRNKANAPIKVGGVLASLLADDLEKETGIKPHVGLYKKVDRLPPDYHLFDDLEEYPYRVNDASIGYTTRGCIRHCPFCAVSDLEPEYVPYIPLRNQIDSTKKDLILLDNNVLASDEFPRIVREIKECDFQKGARFNGKLRRVDFNQGVDARLVTDEKMKLLSEIAIHPLRIAFDHIELKDLYVEKIRLARKYGIRHLSNYILYNFNDTPEDFYERLKINIELNEKLGLSIFSFPMRYIPLNAKTRGHIDNPHWTHRQLRGVHCILHASRGVVGPKRSFFEAAFGKDADEFKYIIEQPEEHIFYRDRMKLYDKAEK